MSESNIEFKFINLPDLLFFQEGPGVRKHQFTNSGVKLLNGGNINNNQLDLTTTDKFISKEEAYGRYKHFLVDEGDLVIASSGVVVSKFDGKIAFVDKSHLPLCMNTSTIRFKVLDETKFDIKYFYFFLKHNLFKNQIQRLITGSAQLNFGPTHLKKIKIPIPYKDGKPDLLTQKRIAKILSHTETLIAKRKESIQMLDEFVKATFLEMFGDPVRNEKGWDVKKLKNITSKIGSGATPRGGEKAYKKEGISLIRSLNVYDNKFKYENLVFIDNEQAYKLRNVIVEENDVLFNITGASVCRCAIVPKDILPARVNQHVSIIRPISNLLNYQYLCYLLTSANFKKILLKKARVGGATREALTKQQVENIDMPIPPLPLQNQFAEIVKKNEALKKQFEQSLQELENLYGSLSQRAFKGELDLSKVEISEEIEKEFF